METVHFAYDALDRRVRQTVVSPGGASTRDERYVYEAGELALVYDLLGGGGRR